MQLNLCKDKVIIVKFNQVTWYSKLLALALFVALPFLGFWLGVKYQGAINPGSSVVSSNPTSKTPATSSAKPTPGEIRKQITSSELTITVSYQNGVYYYSGTIQLPTPKPCHTLSDQTQVSKTEPQIINIILKINTNPSLVACVQMIEEQPFSGQIAASANAVVNVYLNDKLK